MIRVSDRLADVDIFNTGNRYDIACSGFIDFDAVKALEAEQLLYPGGFLPPSRVMTATGWP